MNSTGPNRTRRVPHILVYLLVIITMALGAWPSNAAFAYGTGASSTALVAVSGQASSDHVARQSDQSARTSAKYGREDRGGWGDQDNDDHNNIVIVQNTTDNKFMGQGRVALEIIEGSDVTPGNLAWAESTCVDCETIAVALQLVLYERGATNIAPENVAVALNENCTGCVTVARAVQYVIPVDDPEEVGEDVWGKIKGLNRRLESIQRSTNMTIEEATQRSDAVIADFKKLAEQLKNMDHDDDDDDDD